ncbi:MAG TPA: LuxR C-terminal-related transcriptional regulator [Rugosimonospora sp.]|nr:LuxR C-terminal-related transcriptional regulator [Rugosimonospora sp.]
MSSYGALPPSLTAFAPRLVSPDLQQVSSSDDVVILYGEHGALDVTRLRRVFGRLMPAVLVCSPVFDVHDIVAAFENGATSYFVVDEVPQYCLVDAVVRTAAGQSCLSPSVAQVLVRHVHQPVLAPEPDAAPPPTGELTRRERQIMELLVVGHTTAEIAVYLRLTPKTVRNKLSVIYAKLNVRRQSEAILLWLGDQRTPSSTFQALNARDHQPRHAAQGA